MAGSANQQKKRSQLANKLNLVWGLSRVKGRRGALERVLRKIQEVENQADPAERSPGSRVQKEMGATVQ